MQRRLKRKRSINKKVRNATQSTFDNKLFKSKLELYCYKRLKELNIPFRYEEFVFKIVDGFNCTADSYEKKKNGTFGKVSKKIRPITYKPDFVGNGWIIETKGNPNETWPIRLKLFKKYLTELSEDWILFIPRNKKQVDESLEIIKNLHNEQ